LLEKQKNKDNNIQSFVGNKYVNDDIINKNIISVENSENAYEETGDNLYFKLPPGPRIQNSITPIEINVNKTIHYKTNSYFTDKNNITKEHFYLIELLGNLPNKSESILFYLNNDKQKKLAYGHCDALNQSNKYIVDFNEKNINNIINYEILDQNNNIILEGEIK